MLDTADKDRSVHLIMGGPIKTLGSVMMPFLFQTRENETIKVVLHAMVVPKLTIPVFISHESWLQAFGEQTTFTFRDPIYTLHVGGETFTVDGIPFRPHTYS